MRERASAYLETARLWLATVSMLSGGRFATVCSPSREQSKEVGQGQRMTIAVPSEGFAVTQGEPVVGGLHGQHRQLYCSHWKNWMFTRPYRIEFIVNVRATMLDEHHWYVPFVEVFTAEKLPWATTSAPHSFTSQPDLEGYQPLIEAFAREGARPL